MANKQKKNNNKTTAGTELQVHKISSQEKTENIIRATDMPVGDCLNVNHVRTIS